MVARQWARVLARVLRVLVPQLLNAAFVCHPPRHIFAADGVGAAEPVEAREHEFASAVMAQQCVFEFGRKRATDVRLQILQYVPACGFGK